MIGSKIKELRKMKGLSITKLASVAGVSKSYLSELEKDTKINPSIAYIKKIAEVLEVGADELMDAGVTYIHKERTIDDEWIDLLNIAIKSGLTIEQFKAIIEIFKKSN